MSNQEHLKSFDNNGCPDFNDMVSIGLVPNVYQQLLFGRGASGASNAFATISDITNTEMSTAAKLKVSSASTDDVGVADSEGTGARTVRVYGLDSSWNQQTEDVILNGQTAVETTKTFLHPYLVRVLTAGSGGGNAGIIYVGAGDVTSGVPATKYLGITIAKNLSRSAFFPVPLGYNLIVNNVGFNYNVVSSAVTVTFEGCVKTFGGVWESRIVSSIGAGTVSIPVEATSYPEKTLIKLTASSSGTAATVNGFVNFRLFKVND